MRLLLTNDDGWNAEGIQVLARRLSREHDVWILAPDRNRSAVSHCITMNEPMSIQKHGECVFSCSGVPVDCVVTALRSRLLPFTPDAVISGINNGANIGTDILYSGTASAARQAVLYGVPGIALSIEEAEKINYEPLACFAAKNLEKLIKLARVKRPFAFVNVNAPALDSYKGAQVTGELSYRDYGDSVTLLEAPDGQKCSFFCGGCSKSEGSAASDYALCRKEYVSIARVYAEPQAVQVMDDTSFSL